MSELRKSVFGDNQDLSEYALDDRGVLEKARRAGLVRQKVQLKGGGQAYRWVRPGQVKDKEVEAFTERAAAAYKKESEGIVARGKTSGGPVAPKGKFIVRLQAEPNPDFPSGSHEATVRIEPEFPTVSSPEQAAEIVRKFIGSEDLGGGNWAGGHVTDDKGNLIGKVSYNGRFHEVGDLDDFEKRRAYENVPKYLQRKSKED